MSHIAIVDGPSRDGTYSWFCPEVVKSKCDQEQFGFDTYEDALSAALKSDHKVADDDELPGRFDGIPGLVWYSRVAKTRGDELKVGDWLDSLDHSGARMIYGVSWPNPKSEVRTVTFSFGDTEVVRADVEYDVVDPDSQVTPDGSPL